MNFKKNNGSIALFVFVGLLFMSAFLINSYSSNVNKTKLEYDKFNSISQTYSYNDGNQEAYNRVLNDIKDSNSKIITFSNEYNYDDNVEILLNNTRGKKLSYYKICGNSNAENISETFLFVGDLIEDLNDENNGKYKIPIKITNSKEENKIIDLILEEPLRSFNNKNDYIEFKNQTLKLYKKIGKDEQGDLILLDNIQVSEILNASDIILYEDYSKIEILTYIAPSRIEFKYEEYNLE